MSKWCHLGTSGRLIWLGLQWIIGVYVCILMLAASAPIFQEAGAQLDLVRIMAEFIQRLFW